MTTIEASIWLGEQQVKLYRNNPTAYINAFCTGDGLRAIMREYYRILACKKEIVFLEDLEPGYKAELKCMAIDIGEKRLDKNGLMDLCKCLHIISSNE